MGPAIKKELALRVEEEEPTPLDGQIHVWCMFVAVRGHPCLINFVQTDAFGSY
jgi:hypothetical protein